MSGGGALAALMRRGPIQRTIPEVVAAASSSSSSVIITTTPLGGAPSYSPPPSSDEGSESSRASSAQSQMSRASSVSSAVQHQQQQEPPPQAASGAARASHLMQRARIASGLSRQRGRPAAAARPAGDDDSSAIYDPDVYAEVPNNPYVEQTNCVVPPDLLRARQLFGCHEDRNRANCYLCRAARVNSGATAASGWADLAHMLKSDKIDTDPIITAINQARKFHRMAREANNHLEPGQHRIPLLNPMVFWWHNKMHVKEASHRVENRIQVLENMINTMEENMYTLTRAADGTVQFAIKSSLVKPFAALTREWRMLMNSNTSRMHLASPDYALDMSSAPLSGWVNMKRPLKAPNLPEVLSRVKKRMKKQQQ